MDEVKWRKSVEEVGGGGRVGKVGWGRSGGGGQVEEVKWRRSGGGGRVEEVGWRTSRGVGNGIGHGNTYDSRSHYITVDLTPRC